MNKKKIKITEYFESIQGEGKFAGYPMLFIRTSGCNRRCSYCDTSYHRKGRWYDIDDLVEIIKNSEKSIILWTGGEPLLWKGQIYEIIKKTRDKQHYLETNGDFLDQLDIEIFDFISCSPKDIKTAKKVSKIISLNRGEIKVVTDLDKIGKNLLKYATCIMPLTTFTKKDKIISKKVWDYCVKNNKRFSSRLQIYIWRKKRKI